MGILAVVDSHMPGGSKATSASSTGTRNLRLLVVLTTPRIVTNRNPYAQASKGID